MKRKLLIFLIVLTILFSTSTIYAKSFDYDLFNIEFQTLVNEERAGQGRTPLEVSRILLDLADKRSDEMAEYGDLRFEDENGNLIPHRRPDGRVWSTVFKDVGIKYHSWIGENMAQIYGATSDEKELAQRLFDVWKNSPSHYENMINEDFRYFGIGIGVKEIDSHYNTNYIIISTNLFSKNSDKELKELNTNYKDILIEEKIEIPDAPIITEPVIPEEPVQEIPIIETPKETIKEPPKNEYYYTNEESTNALVDLILWNYHDKR